NASGPQCRRCRAGLSLLFALEEQRRRLLTEASRCATRGEGGPTLEAAQAALWLRADEDARRLRVLGHLLQRDFVQAWQTYHSPSFSREPPASVGIALARGSRLNEGQSF